jgi:paraquat-inducible protein B
VSNEPHDTEAVDAASAEARVGHGPRFSPIWLVPIVAVMIGLWMVYAQWASQGPIIEIGFNSGEDIEAGKTKVKRKNVDIGEVLEMNLTEDAERVVLSVRIQKQNVDLLREDTRFWVVRPRVGPGGISGLGTLLSGAYIEMSPGTSDESAREFEGLEAPPVTPVGTPGLHVTLDSDGDRALDEGDPILFHGMQAGTIEYVHFNTQERRTYYNAFIAAPYDRLITTNTQFWFSSGLSTELSPDGIRVDVANLSTFIAGGVSFDVPAGQPPGKPITERAFFTIHPRESAIYEKYYEHALHYVILFDDSIRGLRPGAPVEYRGLKVGQVLRTDIEYDEVGNLLDETSRIPVLVELVPARFGFDDTEIALQDAEAQINGLIKSGLHGILATGNLLTGQKLVELQYVEHEPHPEQSFAGMTVIPSTSGQVGRLLDNIASTVDKINRLPLSGVVTSVRRALDQTAATLAELNTILEDDASHNVMENLNDALLRFQQLANDFSEGSQTHDNIQQSLESLEQTLHELEPVLRNLRRKPNSLIFGGPNEEDPEPKGVRQ